jgi:transposase-like protein
MGQRKLSELDKQRIIAKHLNGESIRKLARDYKVSRGTVQFTLDPEAAEKNRTANRERMRDKRARETA